MLSYQHQYHAGNHADIIKHWILLECALYLQQKSKPFDYIDTHAGAGLYRLNSPEARKTGESTAGVLKHDWSECAGMNAYWDSIRDDLPAQRYPGSPLLITRLLRSGDRAWLYELHPKTIIDLRSHCERRSGVFVRQEDGLSALPALLPNQHRRALVLIDPSYEIKSDYRRVVDVMAEAYKKMPQTVMLLWYPVVERDRVERLIRDLKKTPIRNAHQFELGVADDDQPGMSASGIIAVNPPWTLAQQFSSVFPQISIRLSKDAKNRCYYEQITAE